MKPLWPHQSRALDASRRAYSDGSRAILIVSPTGSGKTRLATELALSAIRRGQRVLWLTHRAELVQQAAGAIRSEGLTSVGVLDAAWSGALPTTPVQVASIPTLLSRGIRPPAGIVVIDECHHVQARTWRTLTDHYTGSCLVGLTATPERGDGSPLGDVFTHLIKAATYPELVASGLIVDCDVVAPSKRLRSALALDATGAYLEHGEGKQAIIFCHTVEAATKAALRLGGAVVSGETPAEERAELLARFRTGDVRTVSNCMVLTEGFDAPSAEVCVLARAASTQGAYLQMIGRVLRAAPNKRRALVLDLSGAVHEHGWPTADRDYHLTGQAITEASGGAAPRGLWQCLGCGAVLPSRPEHCPRCGLVSPRQKEVKVTKDPLLRQERRDELDAGTGIEAKRAIYRRFADLARTKGYKPGWAAILYKNKFGRWPDRSITSG